MAIKRKTWSLRSAINIGIILFILPLILVVTVASRLFNEQIENYSVGLVQRTANLIGEHQVDQYIEDIEQQFYAYYDIVAANPDLFLTNDIVSNNVMQLIVFSHPEVKTLGVISSTGKYHYVPDWTPTKGVDLRDRPYYREAIAHAGEIIWTEPMVSADGAATPILTMARGIFDPKTGAPKMVLTLNFHLEKLSTRFTRSNLPAGANLVVINENGRIIAYPDNSYLGKNIEDYYPDLAGKIQGQSGILVTNNQTYRAFYQRISNLGWYQLVLIPKQLEQSQIDKVVKIVLPFVTVAIMVFYAMFALIGNIFFNLVLEQVVKLVRAMRNNRLSDNDISIRELFDIYSELHGVNQDIQETQKQAQIDKLTGLFNRGSFDEMLQRLEEQAIKYQLAIIDIDNFKKINDSYGHQMGDTVLRRVSKAGLDTFAVDNNSIIFRYGGEEIVVISVDMEWIDFITLMQRWRQQVGAMTWREPSLIVTFSGGATTANGHEKGEEVLKRADAALYLAKQSGKNQIIEDLL